MKEEAPLLNLGVYLQFKKQALPSLTCLNMRLCPRCFWYIREPHRRARELGLPFTWAHPSQCSCAVFWVLFSLFQVVCGVCSILSLKWLSQHVLVLCQQPLSRWLMGVMDNAAVLIHFNFSCSGILWLDDIFYIFFPSWIWNHCGYLPPFLRAESEFVQGV